MTIYVPCETIARLSVVLENLSDKCDEYFECFRIQKGCIVVSDRQIIVVERVPGLGDVSEPFYFHPSPQLLEACKSDAKFNGKLEITINPMLKYATAKTTFGHVENTNCVIWDKAPTDFDEWKNIVDDEKRIVTPQKMAMSWEGDVMNKIIESSPSRNLVFPEITMSQRPIVIRDINDDKWVAFFSPFNSRTPYPPAKIPAWWNEI